MGMISAPRKGLADAVFSFPRCDGGCRPGPLLGLRLGSRTEGPASESATPQEVLLLDVDGSEWAMKPRHLYVAASRARLRLLLFARIG